MMNILPTAHKVMNAGVAVTAVNGQAISNNNIINQSREDVTIFSFFMP